MRAASCRPPAGSVYSASVTYRDRWRPPAWPGLILGPALALAAALAAAGCSADGTGSASPAATAHAAAAVAPTLTQAEASQVFSHYTAVAAKADNKEDLRLALPVVTGVERAVVLAGLRSRPVTFAGGGGGSTGDPPQPSPDQGAYRSDLTVAFFPGFGQETYRSPAFYLPEQSGYPRFFVASAAQVAADWPADLPAKTVIGGTRQPLDGTAVLMFEQAGRGTPWLLASASELAAGESLPRLATDSAGYVPVAETSSTALTAPLTTVGALQAAVVDDGPASPAAKPMAAGPLTTGMYAGARNHTDGLRAPRGDVYEWQLEGTTQPVFALRTADGGALALYAMTMTETVTVPGIISKADPIRSGPTIPVPQDLLPQLPENQKPPLEELQSQQTLSFAAIDPAKTSASPAQVGVIAIGGGLTYASAT